MTALLVSVRSPEEAEAALAGGAAVIDVKEPLHGSLGRASDEVIAAVVECIAGRAPVSAALGELHDRFGLDFPRGVVYVKWGLARYGHGPWSVWDAELVAVLAQQPEGCQTVVTAYADDQRAAAPAHREVFDFFLRSTSPVFLIDTWQKDGTTLLDWVPLRQLADMALECHDAGKRIALAGSLGRREIEELRNLRGDLEPDLIAVRGAVCQGRQRTCAIDAGKVRDLVELLA